MATQSYYSNHRQRLYWGVYQLSTTTNSRKINAKLEISPFKQCSTVQDYVYLWEHWKNFPPPSLAPSLQKGILSWSYMDRIKDVIRYTHRLVHTKTRMGGGFFLKVPMVVKLLWNSSKFHKWFANKDVQETGVQRVLGHTEPAISHSASWLECIHVFHTRAGRRERIRLQKLQK